MPCPTNNLSQDLMLYVILTREENVISVEQVSFFLYLLYIYLCLYIALIIIKGVSYIFPRWLPLHYHKFWHCIMQTIIEVSVSITPSIKKSQLMLKEIYHLYLYVCVWQMKLPFMHCWKGLGLVSMVRVIVFFLCMFPWKLIVNLDKRGQSL